MESYQPSIQSPVVSIESAQSSMQPKSSKQAMKHAICCSESECCFTCLHLDHLKKHLTTEHQMETVMQFKSHSGKLARYAKLYKFSLPIIEFINWKTEFEEESNSRFIKATGIKGNITVIEVDILI